MFNFNLLGKFKKRTFEKGVHLEDNKECAGREIKEISLAKELIIPLNQSIGSESIPVVKVGDKVKKYQIIAKPSAKVSSYVHSPVFGVVSEIKKGKGFTDKDCTFVHIQVEEDNDADAGDDSKVNEREKRERKIRKVEELNSEDVIDIIRKAGIVGMGGAGFPADVKLSCENRKIDTFILNGCECEPYITADDRIMIEHTERVVLGMQIMMKVVSAKKGYIGVEDNKPNAIKALSQILREKKITNISIKKVKSKYPQGAEGMLVYSILGKKMSKSKLPADYGVVVNNVSTAKAVYDAVYLDVPLVHRVVTVTGGVKNTGNYIVPIGTPTKYIIDELGGLVDSPNLIVSGGPMMGTAQENLDFAVTKTTSCLLFLKQKENFIEQTCIQCGACVNVCPMNLMPLMFAKVTKKKKYNLSKEYYIDSCFECGSCASVCPSKIPIVHYIRVSKDYLRKKELKEKENDN